jgi:hypothetical protein
VSDNKPLKAWQVCGEDIVAAHSWEDAVRWHMREHGAGRDEYDAMADAEPDSRVFRWHDGEGSGSQTIAEILAGLTAGKVPCVIASTEY